MIKAGRLDEAQSLAQQAEKLDVIYELFADRPEDVYAAINQYPVRPQASHNLFRSFKIRISSFRLSQQKLRKRHRPRRPNNHRLRHSSQI